MYLDLYKQGLVEEEKSRDTLVKEIDEAPSFTNSVKAIYNKTYSQSTRNGQDDVYEKIYKHSYDRMKMVSGKKDVQDLLDSTGYTYFKDPSEYISELEKNKDLLVQLKEQGYGVETFEEMQEKEKGFYEEQNRIVQQSATDNSIVNLGAALTGGVGGYFSDPNNLILGFSPASVPSSVFAKAPSMLSAILRGASLEGVAGLGLDARNKPGEIRAREVQGEEISAGQIAGEVGLNLGLSTAAGALGAGLVKRAARIETPEEVLQSYVDPSLPESPEEQVVNHLRELQRVSNAQVKDEIGESTDIITQDVRESQLLNNTLKDIRSGQLQVSDDILLDSGETVSFKQSLEDYEADEFILNTVDGCLNKNL